LFRNRNPKASFSLSRNMEFFFFFFVIKYSFFLCLVVVEVSAIPQALTDDHFSCSSGVSFLRLSVSDGAKRGACVTLVSPM